MFFVSICCVDLQFVLVCCCFNLLVFFYLDMESGWHLGLWKLILLVPELNLIYEISVLGFMLSGV